MREKTVILRSTFQILHPFPGGWVRYALLSSSLVCGRVEKSEILGLELDFLKVVRLVFWSFRSLALKSSTCEQV